ncbi:hypothetical protein ATANTOWER_012975 [Ataeniobius toweri]|uniref:Uncharacterized protein n=1 Tax=Ataeniobius toweri TaxID=208326 RepID=A0ABU7BLN8_9TELE|nr:hypothetical protein [Ataeniobius toweri]
MFHPQQQSRRSGKLKPLRAYFMQLLCLYGSEEAERKLISSQRRPDCYRTTSSPVLIVGGEAASMAHLSSKPCFGVSY